jgi:hypothetical protein
MRTSTCVAAVIALSLGVGAAASAQQANPSARAFGLGNNYVARARGGEAVAWNPANLGLRDNPRFSIATFAIEGTTGLNPVGVGDIAGFSNRTIDVDTRSAWLARVHLENGESGQADAGATLLALSVGRVAFQLSSSAYVRAALSPDAFEAVLFGNAGLTGSPHSLDLTGSTVRGGAFTTGAMSYGYGFGSDDDASTRFAVGVTGKYVVGNALAIAKDDGSAVGLDDVQLRLPIVYSDPRTGAVAGAGVGVDVGFGMTSHSLTIGVSAQNVFNSFAWDERRLDSVSGAATFDGATSVTQFDKQPYLAAPQVLRDVVASDRFTPIISAGVAYEPRPRLTLTADARRQLGDGIQFGPTTQAGIGAELRAIPLVPIRVGGAYVTGGVLGSTGAGIHVGPYEFGVSGMLRSRGRGYEQGMMVSLVSLR